MSLYFLISFLFLWQFCKVTTTVAVTTIWFFIIIFIIIAHQQSHISHSGFNNNCEQGHLKASSLMVGCHRFQTQQETLNGGGKTAIKNIRKSKMLRQADEADRRYSAFGSQSISNVNVIIMNAVVRGHMRL